MIAYKYTFDFWEEAIAYRRFYNNIKGLSISTDGEVIGHISFFENILEKDIIIIEQLIYATN